MAAGKGTPSPTAVFLQMSHPELFRFRRWNSGSRQNAVSGFREGNQRPPYMEWRTSSKMLWEVFAREIRDRPSLRAATKAQNQGNFFRK